MARSNETPTLLRGRVVQPDGTSPDRYLLIREGVIEEVSRHRPAGTERLTCLETGFQDWVFPGLLDLHTHASYNLLPIWDGPGFPYANRFVWRGDDDYKLHIRQMMDYLGSPDDAHAGSGAEAAARHKAHQKTLATFAELQAITGGTTTLQESHSLEREAGLVENVLCRGTADAEDLGLAGEGRVFSVVDFFRPGENGEPTVVSYEDREDPGRPPYVPLLTYQQDRDSGDLAATLVHLAEGRSGFGSEGGVDAYTRAEFERFRQHPAMADAAAVRRSPLTIIHGCGIDTDDPGHLEFLRQRKISVIWSPVSNLLLYGETLDAEKLLRAGVNVALGSDWSPSGSKHVWEEAKFARFFFEAIGSLVSDAQLFQMVTTNAARCLGGGRLGRLEEGCLADLFILRSPLETDNPLEVFFKTTDRDVRAVFVGGLPIYGAREFLRPFEEEPPGLLLQPLPAREGSAAAGKVVHLPEELTNEDGQPLDVDRDVTHLEELMKTAPDPLPKTLRSNLLSSSDTPYRRRLRRLRSFAIDYGWRIQRWRRGRGADPR